jgi:hypothetical protein
LSAEDFCSRLECVRVFLRPPITQRTGCVDLAALIVKPVGELVSDDATGCAVVDCSISIRIKNRRL